VDAGDGAAAYCSPKIDIGTAYAMRSAATGRWRPGHSDAGSLRIEYTDEHGQQQHPLMMRALYGSIQNGSSVSSPNIAVRSPTWLAPVRPWSSLS